MPTITRVLLIIGALIVFYTIAKRVKKDKILMQDAIYWLILGILIVLAALFPHGIIRLAYALGFMSASNFVFLVIVGLLLIKLFSLSCEVSLLRHKVEELSQEHGLTEKRLDDADRRRMPAQRKAAQRKDAGERQE